VDAWPAAVIIWASAFFLFPGFIAAHVATMSADQVAAFYAIRRHLPEIRYSMIVSLVRRVPRPILTLIVMQIRRMAHRTPIFSYAMLAALPAVPPCFSLRTSAGCWPPFARNGVRS